MRREHPGGKMPDDPMEYVTVRGRQLERELSKHVNKAGLFIEDFSAAIVQNASMVFFMLFAFLVLLIFLSPALITSENVSVRRMGVLMYVTGSFLCHQLPQRSIGFLGVHLPIDSRLSGMYLAVVLGGLLPILTVKVPRILKSWWAVPLSILPLAVDGISQTIFVLRESNNTLRFITGFILGFGLTCFLVSYLFRRWPGFRQRVTKKENLVVTVFTTLLLIYLIVPPALGFVVGDYMSRNEALSFARNDHGVREAHSQVYYISPHAVMSMHFDPYLESYNDFVLTDVKNIDWEALQVLADESGSAVMGLKGIWVVVFSDESIDAPGKVIFTNVAGTYYYLDPIERAVIEVKTH